MMQSGLLGVVFSEVLPMAAMRQVLFLGSLSIGYNRDILRGIGDYAAQDHRLEILFPTDYEPANANRLHQPDLSGVIIGACPQFSHFISQLVRTHKPMVDVSAERAATGLTRIITDDQAVGEMAADYFIERGFKSLIYYGMSGRHWSAVRWRGFQKKAQYRNVSVAHFDRPSGAVNPQAGFFPYPVGDWLKTSPRPGAIFAGDDLLGAELIEACQRLGIRVPEDIAILSVDNDDIYNSWRNYRLSSVVLNTREIGRRAVDALFRLIQGRSVPSSSILISPVHIVTRFSTNIFGVHDPLVREALQLIHKDFGNGISVKRLASELAVSRPTLERRFVGQLGRTPAAEISRVQAQCARRKLLDTDKSVAQVAVEAGYSSARQLRAALEQHFGITPRAMRKLSRT
jgi:LacI family transcriptional regulator